MTEKSFCQCLEYCFSFVSASLSSPISFLSSLILSLSVSLSLSPCLVYLLSQSRKSRDYQRDNPSGRGLLLPASTESFPFFPRLPPSVLSYFLSEAGGEGLMMGAIPPLVWYGKNPLNFHPLLFHFSYPSVLRLKFILSTSTTVLPSLLPVFHLFVLFPPTKPDL